jgi:hypothetical protein
VSGTAWTVQFTLFEGEDTPAPLAPATAAPVMAVAPATVAPVIAVAPVVAAPVLAIAPNVTAAPVVPGVPLVPVAPMVPAVNATPVAVAPMVPPIFLTAPVAAAPVVAFVPVLLPTAPATFAPIFNLTAVRVSLLVSLFCHARDEFVTDHTNISTPPLNTCIFFSVLRLAHPVLTPVEFWPPIVIRAVPLNAAAAAAWVARTVPVEPNCVVSMRSVGTLATKRAAHRSIHRASWPSSIHSARRVY